MVVERTLFGQLLPAYAVAHGSRFRVKDLSLVLNAYAKAQLRSTAVFDALAQRCKEQAKHMDCQAMSVIAAAHAKLWIADEPLFQVLAWRLRSCARTCTFQAAANLAHAFAKFGFTGPAMGQEALAQAVVGKKVPELSFSVFCQAPESSRAAVPVTDVVFDAVAEELPRLLADPPNAHSTVLLCHAVARAGQQRRHPTLPAALAAAVAELPAEELQLGMLAVAFAELWPRPRAKGHSDAGQAQEDFWSWLAGAAAERTAQLLPGDAANCAVAFAAAALPPEAVAAMRLAHHCEAPELSPSVASALLAAHAVAGVTARTVLRAIEARFDELLWQATDSVACRLALASWLCGGRVDRSLRKPVASHVLRASNQKEDDADEDLALLATCQGAAALVAPDLRRAESQSLAGVEEIHGRSWVEVSRQLQNSTVVRLHDRRDEALAQATKRLASRLARLRPKLSRILKQLVEAAPPPLSTPPTEGRLQPPRRAGLSSLLLPSAGARLPEPEQEHEDTAAAAAQRLDRALHRYGLAPSTCPLADAAAMLDVGSVQVPVAFVVDDAASYMHPADGDEGSLEELQPDAVLRAPLLADAGWLVVRMRAGDLPHLLHHGRRPAEGSSTGISAPIPVPVQPRKAAQAAASPFFGLLRDAARKFRPRRSPLEEES
ncbi:RGLG2 [Symbiodinium natans]|uniref:RGLG2 protein n=1 Tax=Symbiodinium natans TaxID=878477 RepID=A0A812NZZ7_9DINO|nr:RGLG2 [Symbiodinium natans]